MTTHKQSFSNPGGLILFIALLISMWRGGEIFDHIGDALFVVAVIVGAMLILVLVASVSRGR